METAHELIREVSDLIQDRSFLKPATWRGYVPMVYGQLVQGGNSVYMCTTAGITGASQPSWPEQAGVVNDGSVQWTYQAGISGYIGQIMLSYLNSGIKEIAGKLILPALETSGDVDTVVDSAFANLPNDFLHSPYYRSIRRCYSGAYNTKIKIYGSSILLLRQFANIDENGRVRAVAVRGSQLHYQKIPESAETLTIHYVGKPTDMSAMTDSPSSLPEHLVRPLLINYCARECFRQIEDGIDGATPMYNRYSGLYDRALMELQMFLGPDGDEPPDIEDDLAFDWYANV